jgi:hypothetical protein
MDELAAVEAAMAGHDEAIAARRRLAQYRHQTLIRGAQTGLQRFDRRRRFWIPSENGAMDVVAQPDFKNRSEACGNFLDVDQLTCAVGKGGQFGTE